MSLRGFHIFFICISTLLAFGCALAEFTAYRENPVTIHLAVTACAAIAGIALIIYGVWFLKKSRSLIL